MKIKRGDMPNAHVDVKEEPQDMPIYFDIPAPVYHSACRPAVPRQQYPPSPPCHRPEPRKEVYHPARRAAKTARRTNRRKPHRMRCKFRLLRGAGIVLAALLLVAALRQQVLENILPVGAAEHGSGKVELIYQKPELPNGCEVTSLAMALGAAGCPADKVSLYQTCLPAQKFSYSGNDRFGPDPEECYAGDAASERGGWYCFEDPIVQAAQSWIRQSESHCRVRKVSGLNEKKLRDYAKKEVPLVVWVTQDYEMPTISSFTWIMPNGCSCEPYGNLHCVVLAGMDGSDYRIADPLRGWQTVNPDVFWQSFDAMGRRAVCVQ